MLCVAAPAAATIFGTVRGSVVDAQQHAISNATVRLSSRTSAWQRTTVTDLHGRFLFTAVPIGAHTISAELRDATTQSLKLQVNSGEVVTVPLTLGVPRASASVDVVASRERVDAQSATTQTTISGIDIQRAPGADRTNSLAMITDFVPSATIIHDQLHIRGGHQVDWLIDGVPVPNTNIASTVGPQFDPRDVEILEVQRGGYSAEHGDRTYAVFNVVPRSGFDRAREARVVMNYGSHRSTDDRVDFGSHTDRFAHYASASFNRTDAGLEPPERRVIHDSANGSGVFASLIALPTDSDQLRLVGSARSNRYDVPSSDDTQRERDVFVNVSWVKAVSPSALLTVAPFVHVNSTDFESGPGGPILTSDRRRSQYLGAEGTYAMTAGRNSMSGGAFVFRQQDDSRLSLGSLAERDSPTGTVSAVFVEERSDLTNRLTVRGGLRFTRFDGLLRESAATPRLGIALRLGGQAALRASFSDLYQPPPLSTVSGPLLQFAAQEGFGFIPLHGERDRQTELGLAVPIAGWNLDLAAFRTRARNFFDHDALGNSNIFFPLTIDDVLIRGAELMAQSPLLASRTRLHVAFSHQTIEGEGGITGGLTDFHPAEEDRFFLDHDQRKTLSAGGTVLLLRGAWVSGNIAYGSGFLAGDGPRHLPPHTTFDISAAVPFGRWTLNLTGTNVTNKRYLLDEANTFGGTHWNDPRVVMAQVEVRFHY